MTARAPGDPVPPGSLIDCRRPDQVAAFPFRAGEATSGADAAAADRSHRYRPGRADYPAVLLTRRSFGLDAARILSARPNAPRACAHHPWQSRSRRPPT